MKDVYEAFSRLEFRSAKCWNLLFYFLSMSDDGDRGVYTTIPTLSSVMGIDMRRTYRCIEELLEKNILTKDINRGLYYNKDYSTWAYTILETPTKPKPASEVPLETKKTKRSGRKITEQERKEISDNYPAFWSFWNNYPEMRKYNVRDAWELWKEINPDNKLDELINNALILWMNSEMWIKNNGQFVPAATNFLKNRKWEHAPEPKKDWRDG
jgi:hypothetical protein